MKTIYTTLLIMGMACLTACNKENTEAEANVLLQKSREHFTQGQYDAARDSIMSLRRQFPKAVGTRAKGLLLLDSIEMFAAQDSMGSATGEEWKRLSVKAQFYQRKLQEDKKKLGL